MSRKSKKKGAQPASPPPRHPRSLFWFVVSSLIGLGLLGSAHLWRRPTRIQLDLTTARLAFTLEGEERREILARSAAFSSLSVEDCAAVSFSAERLELADPAGTPAAWRPLAPTDPVQLVCRDPAAKLTLQSPNPDAPRAGILDRIFLEPGSQAILELSRDPDPALTLELSGHQRLSLPLERDIELVTSFLAPEGIALPFQGEPLVWRARLPESRRMLTLSSRERGLILIITPTREQLAEIFPEKLDLPISDVELLEEDLEGRLTSPLRSEATLGYPDYPTVEDVTLAEGDFIALKSLRQTRLRTLSVDTEHHGLRAKIDGIAERATTRAGAFPSDRRLTLLEHLWHNQRLALLMGAAAWLVPVIFLGFTAVKELRE